MNYFLSFIYIFLYQNEIIIFYKKIFCSNFWYRIKFYNKISMNKNKNKNIFCKKNKRLLKMVTIKIIKPFVNIKGH